MLRQGKRIGWALVLCATVLVSHVGGALAAMSRNPTGVNVSTSGPTTLVIRFGNDSAANLFTSTEAVFCAIDPNGGVPGVTPCPAGSILGRLPSALDRGSTRASSQFVTDVMTIPFSVARRAVVQAQRGANSDFFYIRRFDPVGAADLGFGAGVSVYVAVTCRMTGGTARTPLSLTKVELYGDEGPQNPRELLIRVNDANIKAGVVKADINFTGTGVMEGWWEVRMPSDPPIQDIDRFTEGSLSQAQRLQQQRFNRVKRFRLQMPLSGHITLVGPRYRELPVEQPGFYQILLRVQVSKDREALSTFAGIPNQPTNLFSGAAAGFPLPVLEYRVEASLGRLNRGEVRPRLVIDGQGAQSQLGIAWDAFGRTDLVVQIEAKNLDTGETFKLLAPVDRQFAVVPRSFTAGKDIRRMAVTVTVLARDRTRVGEPVVLQQ